MHCIYHKKLGHLVVETSEYEKLLGTKEWFDCPKKAAESTPVTKKKTSVKKDESRS